MPSTTTPPAAATPTATTPPAATPPAATPPAAAPPAAAPPAAAVPPALIDVLIRRGETLLAIGDISGARRFLERAAASGSGRAALAMGGSFDPHVLAELGARGITPDRAAARQWYQRAAALGEAEAASRIAALDGTQ
ncbi:MAG: hypothetical protein IT556_13955 [Acetobacteraceae bacterium]|nr:hypothetical protein [Acetobacteraceae bacterium]